jgi:predicted transcriptional regulator
MIMIKISAAESVVMEALWRDHPLSAEEVIAEVAAPQGWTEATVKTLINRLLNKGAISAEKDGRRYLYRPVLRREDYVAAESQGLLDRLFEGRLAPLVSHFSQGGKLSPDDVAELKRLIQELDDDR